MKRFSFGAFSSNKGSSTSGGTTGQGGRTTPTQANSNTREGNRAGGTSNQANSSGRAHSSRLSVSDGTSHGEPTARDTSIPQSPRTSVTFSTSRSPRLATPSAPPRFSENSSPAVRDSIWYAQDMMLGAGMAIIQPSTGKVVLVYEKRKKYWFLPKGRKDQGESLEEAALREAYEEVRI